MERIFYISKYARNKEQGGPAFRFLFPSYFSLKGFKTILISSNSSGGIHLKFKGRKIEKENGNFKHIILKGPKIKMGFSLKRIISWFEFEYRLMRELKSYNINHKDIIIVSSLSIFSFYTGLILKRRKKAKLVIEVRDIWPQTLIEMSNNKILPFVLFPLLALEKSAYIKSDLIVGTMPNLITHVKRKVSNIPASKIVNIPQGFDENVKYKGVVHDEKKFIVGYAGSIGLANNVGLIIEAAKILRDYNNIEFRILGGGGLKDGLIKYVNELGLKNVIFLDTVKADMVYGFLINCDVLVNPWNDLKIYEYGVSPNKWIDYMYAAKPIIVPYNGYRSIINEANCGEFIETNNSKLLAETIIKYSAMPKKELNEIGKKGKTYLLNNLTYSVLSEKYIKAISNNCL